MGLEALKSAERAAGFAMAADDPCAETLPEAAPEITPCEITPWQAAEPLLSLHLRHDAKQASVADWVKGLFGLSGRGAPA